ncbi:hypothetical protein FK535_26545 [Mycolicibacterium sp. 018/SC-01/001]|uniref:hypothetical protein n=1 Tax=Mycolicibacterium sp. 018/SC-01/001 TaxID=2592069 RepID=UPI00117C180B|nr:hypothetical protein [Mycolicibacterium sp. 018/SC-01/001]TRW77568.1 hypothetical protein FK535_26545 [Mycolicibacterium sp. 018/SC-01/001]
MSAVTTIAKRDVYEEWSDLAGPCGRNKLPDILWECYTRGAFTVGELDGGPVFDTELLACAVQDAWSMAEYPERFLDFWYWQELFLAAEEHLSYPQSRLTVYRGVREEAYRVGMSWTTSLEVARWFAARYSNGSGFVYKLEVEPCQVLAQMTEGRDCEEEVVLDPECIYEDEMELVV